MAHLCSVSHEQESGQLQASENRNIEPILVRPVLLVPRDTSCQLLVQCGQQTRMHTALSSLKHTPRAQSPARRTDRSVHRHCPPSSTCLGHRVDGQVCAQTLSCLKHTPWTQGGWTGLCTGNVHLQVHALDTGRTDGSVHRNCPPSSTHLGHRVDGQVRAQALSCLKHTPWTQGGRTGPCTGTVHLQTHALAAFSLVFKTFSEIWKLALGYV